MRIFRRRLRHAPLNPDFIKYRDLIEPESEAETITAKENGYIPPPIKLAHLRGKKTFFKYRTTALPSSYDLRNEGRVSSVKDQGFTGTCWAFASYGSLESCLLPSEKWDFSENNMKNLMSSSCPEGYDRSANGGGNELMATAYLARWSGPVQEKDDPFDPIMVNCDKYAVPRYIQKVIFIPDRKNSLDNNNLKLAIKNYGAVFTGMYFNDGYYNEENASYYATGGEIPNHAVCLVGWDNNYPGSRFKSAPPGDGAFIVKNSWGSEWGNKGYFTVSYYDIWIGIANTLFAQVEKTLSGDIIHQYDQLGWTTGFGFGTTTAWFANIFLAEEDQDLQGCSFYVASPDSTYKLYVYKNVETAKPGSGELVKEIEGRVSEASYFIKNFATPVALKKDQYFSIMIKLSTPDWNYPVPAEVPIPGYSSKARSEAGQGFISDNGKTWYDIYAEENNSSICLKAFARRKGT